MAASALVAVQEGQGADVAYLFRSYDHIEAPPVDYKRYNPSELNPRRVQRDTTKIWEACRASSAAPTYFNRMTIAGSRYMDGGVGIDANNPAMHALEEAEQMTERQGQERSIAALISVGTGHKQEKSRFGFTKLLRWMKKSFTATEPQHQAASRKTKADRTPYFRFDAKSNGHPDSGVSHIRLDDCKKQRRAEGTLAERVFHRYRPRMNIGHYDPGRYRYTTYEILKERTEAYCSWSVPDNHIENIQEQLSTAAKILVWYRRRRELDDGRRELDDPRRGRWEKFSEHPYKRIVGPPENIPNGTPTQHPTQAQANPPVNDGPQNHNTPPNQTATPIAVTSDHQNGTQEHRTPPVEIELQELIPSEGQASTSVQPESQSLNVISGHDSPSTQDGVSGSAQTGTST